MPDSPISETPYYEDNQDLGYATINEAINRLENAGFLVVQDRDETDPTALSPTNGQCWLVPASAVNDWLGHDGEVAAYYDGWIYRSLRDGEILTILDEGSGGTGKSVWFNNAGTLVNLHNP